MSGKISLLSAGESKDLAWLDAVLRKELEVKTQLLGPESEKGERHQISFLNRIVSWEAAGIRYEPDPDRQKS